MGTTMGKYGKAMGNNHQEILATMGNTIIPFGDCLYHSFMVILAMVDYWVYHFTWLFMEYMNAIGTLYSQALFVEFSYPWLFLTVYCGSHGRFSSMIYLYKIII
jgi:hypothetical protein